MRQGKAEAGAVQRVRGDREQEITRRKPVAGWGQRFAWPKPTAPPIRKPMTWPKIERRVHAFAEAETGEARNSAAT